MLERKSSTDNFFKHHHHTKRSGLPRHSCLHQQKPRLLIRQSTSFHLTSHKGDDNNNETIGPSVGQAKPTDINANRCLRRQKSKQHLVRQFTSFTLQSRLKSVNLNTRCASVSGEDQPDSSTTGRTDVSNKVKFLLLKLSHTGLIKSFVDLDYSYEADNRIPGESDALVTDYTHDNIAYAPDITAKIINKNEFELGQVLGAGGFGRVYTGTFRGEKVAIKVMHKFTKNPDAQIQSFKAELHVMRFNHPNVVQTLAATHIDQFDDGAWIVMEYVSQRCLQTVINYSEEEIGSDRRLKYAIQIASALQYAHKRKVAHLDLKPANILITEDDNCKVGDFGCSQKVEFDTGIVSPTNRSILTGTFAYRAPELLRGEPPTFKADIYSYGVTLWQILSRETPFSNENQHVVIFNVCAKGLRPRDPSPSETEPFELSYKSLYAQCWDACPLDRPSAQELVELLSVWKDNM